MGCTARSTVNFWWELRTMDKSIFQSLQRLLKYYWPYLA